MSRRSGKKQPKEFYALIKWVSDGTYTPLPLSYVKAFDVDEFLRTNWFDPEESFAVEWRNKTKKPKRGWRCYVGFVVAISSMFI